MFRISARFTSRFAGKGEDMKRRAGLVLTVALAGAVLLIGCQPLTTNWSASTDCKACHSAETGSAYGPQVLAAQGGYEQSGHFNGPRVMVTPAVTTATGELFESEGSNTMYTNSCGAKCHSDQGFVQYVSTGTASPQSVASQPGCFTCHKPHETGDFSLRTSSAVALVDGTTTFNSGSGNLCANCHQSLSHSVDFLATGFATTTQSPGTPVKKWRNSDGPHHGPQSDFMMGANSYASTTSYIVSKHINAPVNSCVGCHKYEAAVDLRGSLQMGGHGFYLTGAVHGAQKDITALCVNCHTTGTTFPTTHAAAADWDGSTGAPKDQLVEIKGLRDRLIIYFSTPGNFPAGTPAPITNPAGGALGYAFVTPSTIELHRDFAFNPSATQAQLTLVQSQSFWNLRLYIDDNSQGIHNPTFAAQMLWDAINNLNVNAGAGITVGPRP